MIFLYLLIALMAGYALLTLFLMYLVHQIPRNPVVDTPDWGTVRDEKIPIPGGGFLEVWRIDPDIESKGVVLFMHGWGRNRDRMVNRARLFGSLGFTTVIHSARDHGKSSPKRFMNAARFAEDIETVMGWIGEPVILYGHSAGAGGAIIAASRNPERIRLLFLEGCYAETKEALMSLYRWANNFFGTYLAPAVLFWMDLFYGGRLNQMSPTRLARGLALPVMIVHGERDDRFPLEFALRLKESFPEGTTDLYVGQGAGHSDSSLTPGYPAAVKRFLDRHKGSDWKG
jgi:pimeloyl-ACP methyl ester carboxylesterase